MEFGKLIPQVFFDLLARSVPGSVVLGAWIVLLGQDQWAVLLNALLAGYLDRTNVVPIATLTFAFASFVVGHLLAPTAKWVQRGNEWRWVKEPPCTGEYYDWLRANHPDAGALCAKIRAEFLMCDALAVGFLVVAAMAFLAGAIALAIGSAALSPLMVYRGGETEKTYHKTVGKMYRAHQGPPCEPPDSDRSDPVVTPSQA